MPDEEINTRVVEEMPVLTLSAIEGYGDLNEDLDIYADDVKKAEIGYTWSTTPVHVTRSAHDEEATVVYKNDNGAAVLVTRRSWPDSPNPVLSVYKELIWISYH